MPSTDPRITKARKEIAKAVKEAAEVQTDPSLNRSTATRKAYKVKADALDRVGEALSSRSAPKRTAPKATSARSSGRATARR